MSRHRYKYSTRELVEDLRRVSRLAGRAVFSFPIYEEQGRYAATTVISRFGTWRQACAAAGIEPVRLHPYWRANLRKQRELGVTLLCLKCDEPFQSWDPKRNRICPGCAQHHGDEEITYAVAL